MPLIWKHVDRKNGHITNREIERETKYTKMSITEGERKRERKRERENLTIAGYK